MWTSHRGISLWLDNAGPQQTRLLCGFTQGCVLGLKTLDNMKPRAPIWHLTWSTSDCISVFSGSCSAVRRAPSKKSCYGSAPWPRISWLDDFVVDSLGPIITVKHMTKSSLRRVNGKLLWRGLSLLMGIQDWLKAKWISLKDILLEYMLACQWPCWYSLWNTATTVWNFTAENWFLECAALWNSWNHTVGIWHEDKTVSVIILQL